MADFGGGSVMNTTNFVYPMSSQTYHPHMGQHSPVSEESVDLQNSSLKPIEQSAKTDGAPHATQSESGRLEEQKAQQERMRQQQAQQAKQEQSEQQTIKKLSTLDREVRNHELAHASVGGKYAGSPTYQYERGPDGINYAVAGEVTISTSPIKGNPELTIEKAQIIRRAALAPADPSPQDQKVAMEALQLEAEARVELSLERQQEQQEADASANEDKQTMVSDNKTTEQGAESELLGVNTAAQDDTVDTLNKTQEDAFNEINNELTAQLVALGGAELTPRSLGSIVNHQI